MANEIEVTEVMIDAGIAEAGCTAEMDAGPRLAAIFRAMLAAGPAPSSGAKIAEQRYRGRLAYGDGTIACEVCGAPATHGVADVREVLDVGQAGLKLPAHYFCERH